MMNSEKSKIDILIVGAGLSGLSASISCALAGHRVTVLESTKALVAIGAGLQITPNASRLLQRWGVMDEELKEKAAIPTALTVHRYSDGLILAQEQDFDEHLTQKYGAPFFDLHRADLQIAMVRKANELGVEILLDKTVDSIDFVGKTVHTQAGESYSGDIIIAADGLWSKCRNDFLGKELNPLPTGDLAYRIVLKLDQISDPELREIVERPTVHFWVGPNSHVVSYSIRAGKEFNLVLLVPDDLPKDIPRQSGSVEEMRALFRNWDPILTRFLECVDRVDKWRLLYLDALDSWISPESNFVMIGDACHPMLPYLAQGANSSIEDGAMLGAILGHLSPKFELPQALQVFESLRKPRGEAIVQETFKQRDSFHMVDGPEQQARDDLFFSFLGKTIDRDFPSRWTCPKVQPWLYGYDVDEEVEKAMRQV